MRTLTAECLEMAIADFKRFLDVVGEDPQADELKKSFRSRCIELPEYVASQGLLQTLSFYFSQTKGKYSKVVEVLESKGEKNFGREEFAYGICLHFVLNRFFGTPRDPLEALKTILRENPLTQLRRLNKLMIYLTELKKLAEAMIEPEEG